MWLKLKPQRIQELYSFIYRNIRSTHNIVPRRLENKIALVTASSHGIGFAIARRLAQEGAKVVITGRTQKGVNQALKKLQETGLRVLGTYCNIGNTLQRSQLLEMANSSLGGIEILVLNTGINPEMAEVLDASVRAWDKTFHINVKSTFILAKEVLPYMKKRNKGKIVITSSIAGYVPLELLGAYSISKTALLGMTKAIARQLAQDKIYVNSVAPGIIETRFSDAVMCDLRGRQDWIWRELYPMYNMEIDGTCANIFHIKIF